MILHQIKLITILLLLILLLLSIVPSIVNAFSCNSRYATTYKNPGSCSFVHLIKYAKSSSSSTSHESIFTADQVPGIFKTVTGITPTNAKEFKLYIEPSACSNFEVTVSGAVTITSNTVAQLLLVGVESVTNYVSMVRTIKLGTCSRPTGTIQTYSVLWEFYPAGYVYVDTKTDDTRWFAQSTVSATWDVARTNCASESVWGLSGYLASIPNSAVNDAFIGAGFSSAFIGLSDEGDEGTWKWRVGPESGTVATFTFWDTTHPTTDTGKNCGFLISTGAKWRDRSCTVSQEYICGFAGTSGTPPIGYRGMIDVRVSHVPCKHTGTTSYRHIGPCFSTAPILETSSGTTVTYQPFSVANVPSIFDETSGTDVDQIKVSMSPSLCAAPTLSDSGGITSTSTTSLVTLTGSGSPNAFVTVLRTLSATSCPATSQNIILQEFVWEMSASGASFSVGGEPHYVRKISQVVHGSDAAAACQGTTLLGMTGYAAAPLDSAAWTVTRSFAQGWIGARSTSDNIWTYREGPSAYAHVPAAAWMTGEPRADGHCAVEETSKNGFDDTPCVGLSTNPICEYGGTMTIKPFRGSVVTRIRSTACKYTATNVEPGPCVILSDLRAPVNSVATRNLFAAEDNPLMDVDTPSGQLTGFTVSVTPDMCSALEVAVSSGITVSTTTASNLILAGTASSANYLTTVRTIKFKSCAMSYAWQQTYNFEWFFTPHTTLSSHVVGSETHYYAYYNEVKSWYDAQYECSTKTLLGLPGYLVTIADSSELAVVSGNNGWIGASDDSTNTYFTWRGGPESSHAVTYTVYNSGEPSDSVKENCLSMFMAKYSDEQCATATLPYTCEFGGMASL
eukprot:PhM_4_TR13103/c0_g1_i1/m.83043